MTAEHLSKPPIEPIHSQAAPNEPIGLGAHRIEFVHDGKTYSDTATVTMRFAPKDRLTFVIPGEGTSNAVAHCLFNNESWDGKLKLVDRNVAVDVFCSAVGRRHGGIVFSPRSSGFAATPSTDVIATAVFHLFNFPDIQGPDSFVLPHDDPPPGGSHLCGRAILKADGWVVTIAATGRTSDLTDALDAEGGFVITHVGRIEHEDGSTFSSDELIKFEACLSYYLSFALGRWAGVNLVVGVDATGNRVYEQWGMRRNAEGPWTGSLAWFDSMAGGLLGEVFPGFVKLWKSNSWNKSLTHALYWYIAACEGGSGRGVDTGLILAQTALELLAWTYCVCDRKMVSAAAFGRRGLSAADKLRLMASSLGIPLEIHSRLAALHSNPGRQWSDSMDAITSVRNSLIHPDAQRELPHNSYYDAWRLSLWYLDLTLLRLCGHNGEYSHRLARRYQGQLEVVPWAPGNSTALQVAQNN